MRKNHNVISIGCWFAFILFMAALQTACSSGSKAKKAEASAMAMLDTLEYGKSDYDSMRAYFSVDTSFQKRLNKGILEGDTNAVKVSKLLATEYESRAQTGFSESQIEALIFIHYSSKNLLRKFEEINGRLPSRGDGLDRGDSLVQAIENLKRQLGKQK